MSLARRQALAEAQERDDPLNAVLDMVEAAVRTAIAHDLEAPLRRRLDALLPKAPDAPRVPAGESLPVASDSPSSSQPDATPSEEIELVALVRACAEFSKIKASAHAHAAVARIKARAEADLSQAKKRRTS